MQEPVRYSLIMEIGGLPRMTNASGRPQHWAIKAKEKTAWKNAIALLVPFVKRPPAPISRARLVLTRFSTVSPDSDGLVSGFKHVIDGLVDIRILKNDKVVNIGMPEYRWKKAKPNHGKIRIELYELDENTDMTRTISERITE